MGILLSFNDLDLCLGQAIQGIDAPVDLLIEGLDAALEGMAGIFEGGLGLLVLLLQGKHFFDQFHDFIMGGLFGGIRKADPFSIDIFFSHSTRYNGKNNYG
jgi:hypothetical protein